MRHRAHVPLHRLWTIAKVQAEMSPAEQSHMLDCDECRNAFSVCLKAESFSEVVSELSKAG